MSSNSECVAKGKIFASVSGGRTSMMMAKWIKDNFERTHDVIYIYANTGREHEKTLEFIDLCDNEWSLGVVWVEAEVYAGRIGTGHRVVNFETAARYTDPRPYEEMIKKYGIPNRNYPHCTRELKQAPMYSYLKSIGWKKGDYQVAIGIRADEFDRISVNAKRDGLVYPLVKMGITKQDVLSWWKGQDFDLDLPEHLGNCMDCWKKSDRKLFTAIRDIPDLWEFPMRMEKEYANAGAGLGPRVFFRGGRSAEQMLELSKQHFSPWVDGELDGQMSIFDIDLPNGCGESCEVSWEDVV